MILSHQKAKHFIENETQFHLGFLPTEQSHSKTANLSETIAENTSAGVDMILSIEEDIVTQSRQIFADDNYRRLVDCMTNSVKSEGRIIFSGCGATGRLSILLEKMWRQFWRELEKNFPELAKKTDAVKMQSLAASVMTGGDRALIRSVENFEDFQEFGREQMRELGVCDKDTVVAISEGGETSSVIGTAWQGVDAGASVFFVFNNPVELLDKHIARSGELIRCEKVTVLDLTSGPMAVAGSTRMQATTFEMLIVASAMEEVLQHLLRDNVTDQQAESLGLSLKKECDKAELFRNMVNDLRSSVSEEALAAAVEYEYELYQKSGLVTYFAEDYLIDILTDTTERAPTFMLPPFRKIDDTVSACSWAFLKHPYLQTRDAWAKLLCRQPRCLTWNSETYSRLGAPQSVIDNPPPLDEQDLYRFQIGCENDPSRYDAPDSAAVAVLVGDEVENCLAKDSMFCKSFFKIAKNFNCSAVITISPSSADNLPCEKFAIQCHFPPSPMRLWEHLAVKLVMNTVSTATMAIMGRVRGNWMVYAEATNKKLIDRACRLIESFTGVDYEEACKTLHEVLDEIALLPKDGSQPKPPSILTIEKIKNRK